MIGEAVQEAAHTMSATGRGGQRYLFTPVTASTTSLLSPPESSAHAKPAKAEPKVGRAPCIPPFLGAILCAKETGCAVDRELCSGQAVRRKVINHPAGNRSNGFIDQIVDGAQHTAAKMPSPGKAMPSSIWSMP